MKNLILSYSEGFVPAGLPLFIMLLYVAFVIWMIILYIKLYYHVKNIREQSQCDTAFYYVAKATKCAATAATFEIPERMNSYYSVARKNLVIALYFLGQGKIGTIPPKVFPKFDGNSDFGDFIKGYILEEIKKTEDLIKKCETPGDNSANSPE